MKATIDRPPVSRRTLAKRLRAEMEPIVRNVMAASATRIERLIVISVKSPEGDYTGGTVDCRDGLGTKSFGIRWYENRPKVGDVVLVEFPPPTGTRRVIAICREVAGGSGGNASLASFAVQTGDNVGVEPDGAGNSAVVYAADFGATGNGYDDDTSALQDAIDAVTANGGGTVVCVQGGIHLTTSSLLISASIVQLDQNGSTIRRMATGLTDPVIHILTPEGSDDPIIGPAVRNGAIDGNGTALISLEVTSVQAARLANLQMFGAVEWQLVTDCYDGDSDNLQLAASGLTVVATDTAGGVLLDGSPAGDAGTVGAHIDNVQVAVEDGDAFFFQNADTNTVDLLRSTVTGTGRDVVFAGSDTADANARNNHIYHAALSGPVYSLAADFSATGNYVTLNSGSPAPVVEDGSDIGWVSDHVGILGVDEMPTLPDAAYPPGKAVLFLRVDDPPYEGGKLYRNVADVWTAAVPAADITDLDTSAITSDGVPPASSPTPTVEAGIGSLVARWTPVTNNDFVIYEVHVSGTTGFTPGPTTLYGETPGASIVIRKKADGSALAQSTSYYVKLIAKDEDGSAAAGSQGTSQVAQVVTADITAGAVTTLELGAAAVSHAKLAVNAVQADVILAGTITATELGSAAVTHAKLAVDAVQADIILAGTITATQIANNAITTPLLNAGAVTTAKIAAGAVTATEIAANTITAAKIAAGTITATELATDSVTSAKILAGSVTAAKVATDTLTANEIAAGAISTSELAAGAVTAAKITAGTITATEIAGATITGAKIAAGTITATNMLADTLTANEIAAGAISTSELAAGAVTAAKITAGTITTTEIAAGTILAANIAAATITGAKIAATTITAANIAADTITAGEIAANAISTSELAANAVTAAKILANTITAGQIAAGTITTTEIAADTITAGNIAANAITTSELNALAVTSAKIAANTIVAGNIAAGTITATEIAANTITTAKLAVTASVGYVDNSIGGSVTYGVIISPTGITISDQGGTSVLTGGGFGGPWLSYITSHVYNGVFDSGPTGGNGTTLTTGSAPATTVPNWTLINFAGTHTVFTWRNDAAVGRAGQLRLNLTATGAAGDQSYVYQNVPIAPAGSTAEGTHVVSLNGTCTTNASGNPLLFLKAQYYKADGTTTTGTEGTTEWSPAVGNLDTQQFYVSPNSGVQPTDAAYLRVKVGIRRATAATSATMQIEIYGVTVYDVPRYLFFGQGTHMGALTRGTDSVLGGGTVYLGPFDPVSGGFNFGVAMTSTLFRFDTAVTLTDNVVIAGTGTTFTVTDYQAMFRRDDGQTTTVNRYFSGASTAGGIAAFTKSRASVVGGTDAAVVAGDTIYSLQFQGMDSASGAYQIAAAIYGMADTGGTVAAGRVDGRLSFRTAQAGTLTEQVYIGSGGSMNFIDGNNLVFGAVTGSKIGQAATQKLSFWGAATVAQAALAPTGLVGITAAGATNTWFRSTSTTGGIAGNAYTVPDIVFALKTVGILP